MIRFIAMVAAVAALSACDAVSPRQSVMSPDGRTLAKVEMTTAGTPARLVTQVVVSGGGLPSPIIAVEADNARVGLTRLRWVGSDHLLVDLCEAQSYRVSAVNLRASGRPVEGPDALWVDVENQVYSPETRSCLQSWRYRQ